VFVRGSDTLIRASLFSESEQERFTIENCGMLGATLSRAILAASPPEAAAIAVAISLACGYGDSCILIREICRPRSRERTVR
jgi:hypothetical protein